MLVPTGAGAPCSPTSTRCTSPCAPHGMAPRRDDRWWVQAQVANGVGGKNETSAQAAPAIHMGRSEELPESEIPTRRSWPAGPGPHGISTRRVAGGHGAPDLVQMVLPKSPVTAFFGMDRETNSESSASSESAGVPRHPGVLPPTGTALESSLVASLSRRAPRSLDTPTSVSGCPSSRPRNA
jgi:hypothetical protein